MQQRPQGTVGEAVVVVVVVGAVQIQGNETRVAVLLFVHGAAGFLADFPAPAEPQPAAFAQCTQQAHRQTAGAVFTGQCDPVGHHHQPAHDASCHERDNRIAAMIRPTCE